MIKHLTFSELIQFTNTAASSTEVVLKFIFLNNS